MNRAQKAALASAGVGLVVLALKFGAYWLTGSLALYSDALESIINVVAAGAAFIALRVASKPADGGHPYGHHKAEYFSAVIEGVMIVLAAILILIKAYDGILAPRPLDAPALGLAVNAVATAINLGWAVTLLRWGRTWRSPALVADGRHVMTDVWSSGGVLIGVALVAVTGWLILDPILAAIVAVNILWSGWVMIRDSVSSLMDASAPPEILDQIAKIIATHSEGAQEAHDVRTRQVGSIIFIDFHLVVQGTMSVTESHAICDRIELALRQAIEGARVTIHVEPEEKAKHKGVPVLLAS
ncbi:cation diffusion facilitator family transporter [Labrys neptuniae]|uniref:Cation diffusion facilitator family transporter n=1 Tax=Labrys neptuniae TaxID=376174 RepID=A0ABV3PH61_9HYPH|nr:cation diffusion facilitator family transporter [Labrys neptuniae]MDT3377844.1 cation diffusion facilitator family transporter [Labrys neptuniae]